MAQGFLSLFDDPVVGPQLALGALSTGVGLLSARRPGDINEALQGGISNLSQAAFYGGMQKQKQDLLDQKEQEKAARRAEGLARFSELLGGQQAPGSGPDVQPPPPGQPGTSTSPFVNQAAPPPPMVAPTGPAQINGGGGGGLTPEEALELAFEFPEMRPALMPRIKEYGQAPKLSEAQQRLEDSKLAGLTPEQGQTALQRWLGHIPDAGSEQTATALEKYRQMQEARLNRGQALSDADRDAARANTEAYRAQQLKQGAAGGGGTGQDKAPSGYRWTEGGGLEAIPGGPATKAQGGVELSYDAEGRPIFSMGGSGKPFTEAQSKAMTNIALADAANQDMDKLKEEGFDPTSIGGAAGVTAAGIPGLNVLAPEKAQRQNTANQAFAQSVNYQRSGAATPEPEYNRAVQSVIDKHGDAPETQAAKRRYRVALVEAVKAQDPRIDTIVGEILSQGLSGGSGGGTPSRSEQGKPTAPAAPAADEDEEILNGILGG